MHKHLKHLPWGVGRSPTLVRTNPLLVSLDHHGRVGDLGTSYIYFLKAMINSFQISISQEYLNFLDLVSRAHPYCVENKWWVIIGGQSGIITECICTVAANDFMMERQQIGQTRQDFFGSCSKTKQIWKLDRYQ